MNNEEETEEKEFPELNYIPSEISNCFDLLIQFQEELIDNINTENLFSNIVDEFILNYESQFLNFNNESDKSRKVSIKVALQLIDSILRSRKLENYKKLSELLIFLENEIQTLFKPNELVDIFVYDKQSIFLLYEMKFISIQDIISIPFIAPNKPAYFLTNFSNEGKFVKKNLSNPSNSLIRKSFSTSASTFNANSNFNTGHIQNIKSPNIKLGNSNFKSNSNSGFRIPQRKMSFDFTSPTIKTDSNIEDNSNQISETRFQKFEFTDLPCNEIVSIFRPEIEKFDSDFVDTFPSLFNFLSEEIKKDDGWNSFSKYRKDFQNESKLAQIISSDNVDQLQDFISNPLIENIESISMEHSIFERINFLNEKDNPLKIIEYAAFCGSVKIFKFLLLGIHGNSTSSTLPPLHLYQQEQLEQREKLIQKQEEQLYSLQHNSQIGLIQKQQQIQIQKQQEQLKKYQAQFQQKYQMQQAQFQQQQQQQILKKIPSRLHMFVCAGGNAEMVRILAQEGIFSDKKKLKEAVEISIRFHQNNVFDYFITNYEIEASSDLLITCVKACNYYCFLSFFDKFHSELVNDINKKDQNGQNVLQTACALGRWEFVRFLTSIDFDLEKELIRKNVDSNPNNVGLNINIRDANGFAPLHLAAAGGHLEIVDYLCSFYSDKNKTDLCGKTDDIQDAATKHLESNSSLLSNTLKISPMPLLDQSHASSNSASLAQNQPPSTLLTPNQLSSASLAQNQLSSASLAQNQLPSALLTQNQLLSASLTQNQLPSTLLAPNQLPSTLLAQNQLPSASLTPNQLPSTLLAQNQLPSASLTSNQLSPSSLIQSPVPPNSKSILNAKSAPTSPKLVKMPSLITSPSNSIRRKLNANSVSFQKSQSDQFSKTISLGSLSYPRQLSNFTHLNLNVKDFKGLTSAQLSYENGFCEVSKYLISQPDFEINSKDDSSLALIHIAAMKNDLEFIEFMTREKREKIDVNIETKKNHLTAFLIAASNGNLGIVKYLISLGSVNKKCRDIKGQMAHHLASSSSSFSSSSPCVRHAGCSKQNSGENGADIDDSLSQRKLMYVEKYSDYYLNQSIKRRNFKQTSLDYRELNENEASDGLLERSSSKDDSVNHESNSGASSTESKDDSGCTDEPIESTATSPSDFPACSTLSVLKFLIGDEGFDVNEKDDIGQTPLHHACVQGDISTISYLVSVPGILIDSRDKDGRTPLILSFINGNLDVAKYLLKSTTADLSQSDNDGRNSLHLSSQRGLYENVVFICSLMDGMKSSKREKGSRKASFFAEDESEDDNEDEAAKFDINTADNFGRTCLHLSFESGNVDLIKFLLQKPDVDLNARDKGGRTILHFAASFNYFFVIEFLSGQGTVPRKLSYRTSFTSYNYPTFSSGRNKFDWKNVNAKANHDWTALHFAASGGFVEMCQFLISIKYVNANARDSTGMTPLHLAVQYNKIDAVKFLVNEQEIYVNSQDNDGRTPLHLACSLGEVDIIKILVKCKEIDLTKLDKKSQTAFKHLTVENQKSLLYLFKK